MTIYGRDRNIGKAVQSRGEIIIMYAVYGNACVIWTVTYGWKYTADGNNGRSHHQCSAITSIY